MIENFAIAVIGLSFLAIPMLAFKIVYDDIKRDKKQIKGVKMGEIVPYFALAVCLFFALFALYQIKQLDKA